MTDVEVPVCDVDDWEARHAALVGRRDGPIDLPPSGEFWTGTVKAEITATSEGFRWFLVSGDGRFQLAQSPTLFVSAADCEQHLRKFSPSVPVVSNHLG